jgi:hypothetical protein
MCTFRVDSDANRLRIASRRLCLLSLLYLIVGALAAVVLRGWAEAASVALLGDCGPLAMLFSCLPRQAAYGVALLAPTFYLTAIGAPVFHQTPGFREWSLTLLAALVAGFVLTVVVETHFF